MAAASDPEARHLRASPEFVATCLMQMRDPDPAIAWSAQCALRFADPMILPLLVDAFRQSKDRTFRSGLLEVLLQHRRPESVAFLAELLGDRDSETWKGSLDVLVTIGPPALEALKAARDTLGSKDRTRREWIEEAIQQIQEPLSAGPAKNGEDALSGGGSLRRVGLTPTVGSPRAAVFKTADLCDSLGSAVQVAQPVFLGFGGRSAFTGPIVTVRVFEDNGLVRATLEAEGEGRVLVVDGGGSLRCALVGDRLAELALSNGWEGIVVNGCVRDTVELAAIPLGVKALAACPRRSVKTGAGERDLPVTFAGLTFHPGHRLYADADGIVVVPDDLRPSDPGLGAAAEQAESRRPLPDPRESEAE